MGLETTQILLIQSIYPGAKTENSVGLVS